uniref:Uncharacterized protein n=1 Tax=Romanomermis culicivorax TaxID=13658 RepID=A0A915JJ20_ROMCU
MAGGVKNVTGGSMDDTFVVGIGPITGIIEGLHGMDVLDLSSFSPEKLNVDGDILEYELGPIRGHLLIKGIEMIILPIGRRIKNSVNVSVEDNIQRIVSSGKTNIVVQSRSIDHGLILELSANTNVTDYAKNGAISYLILPNDDKELEYTSLSIFREPVAKQEVFFLQNLWDLENYWTIVFWED